MEARLPRGQPMDSARPDSVTAAAATRLVSFVSPPSATLEEHFMPARAAAAERGIRAPPTRREDYAFPIFELTADEKLLVIGQLCTHAGVGRHAARRTPLFLSFYSIQKKVILRSNHLEYLFLLN